MSGQDNRQLAEEYYAALNSHAADELIKFIDESYTLDYEVSPAPVRGPEGLRHEMEAMFTAFPDLRFEIEQTLADEAYVVVRWHATGTHRGEYAGIPPTDKTISTRGCTIHEVRSGKIIKARIYADFASLFRQLGAVPAGKSTTAG